MSIPSIYQQVEYVQTDGNQYIDTGVIPSDHTDGIYYELDFAAADAGSNNTDYLFGCLSGEGRSGNFGANFDQGNIRLIAGSTSSHSIYNWYTIRNRCIVRVFATSENPASRSLSFERDGTVTTPTPLTSTFESKPMPSESIYLFNCRGISRISCAVTCWGFNMSAADGTPIRNFVPCYRKSDNAAGLYDTVTSAFYENAGTGTFVVGADVYTKTYTIESNTLQGIADAIRAKTGSSAKIIVANFASEIGSITGGESIAYPLADKPETMGQVACLSRIKQMRDITYTPVAPLPYNYGTLPAGDPVTGIVYSAVRVLDNYVGYKISLHTFMTAIKNPKSFLYTKTASGTGNNVRCWYGVTCSTFVGYAYDFDYPIQTYIFPELEGIEEVAVEDMKLCDAANVKSATATTGGHIVIISGIERDADGNIVNVEITEANLKGVQATTMTYASFVSQYINSLGYKIYRNRKLYETSYKPSKYIRLFDDEPGNAVVYSDICTDWGDRAAIRTDEAITLNPINTDGYSAIKLYRNGEEIGNYGLTDVALSNLEVGTYTAKLYPEAENASTSFMVSQVYAEKEGNKYTFTAEGAKPLRIIFKDSNGFTLNSVKLESEDILLGYKEIDYSNESVGIIQVVFQNDFGYVLADCIEIEVPAEIPEEYQEVEYIETSGGQYIDTGVLASNYQDGISYVFSGNRTGVTNASATTYLWGVSHNGARSGNLGITAAQKYGIVLGGTSGMVKQIDVSAVGEDFTIELTATSKTADTLSTVTALLNGVAFSNVDPGTNTDMPAANIYLFAANGIDTARSYKGTLYSFTMDAADGTPIRNFVPCYRKSDNVIGLYDMVEGKFYTNAGTGAFTKGANV